MKLLDNAVASVTETFGYGREREITSCLIDFVINHPSTKHINLQLVKQIANEPDIDDATIIHTLQYLSGERVRILELRFEFIDNDDPVDITKDEAKNALWGGVNPLTGETDLDSAKKVFLYFEPAEILRNEFKKH